MHATLIMLNIILSALMLGGVAAIVALAMRLSHGYPPGRGRADWRGPGVAGIAQIAASTATAANSRAR
jgi:hypothetical protein